MAVMYAKGFWEVLEPLFLVLGASLILFLSALPWILLRVMWYSVDEMARGMELWFQNMIERSKQEHAIKMEEIKARKARPPILPRKQ